MRISDWSSDVCSSDLSERNARGFAGKARRLIGANQRACADGPDAKATHHFGGGLSLGYTRGVEWNVDLALSAAIEIPVGLAVAKKIEGNLRKRHWITGSHLQIARRVGASEHGREGRSPPRPHPKSRQSSERNTSSQYPPKTCP